MNQGLRYDRRAFWIAERRFVREVQDRVGFEARDRASDRSIPGAMSVDGGHDRAQRTNAGAHHPRQYGYGENAAGHVRSPREHPRRQS